MPVSRTGSPETTSWPSDQDRANWDHPAIADATALLTRTARRHHSPGPYQIQLAVSFFALAAYVTFESLRALGSNAVVADGTQTLLCTYLSAVLLVIAGVAVREGLEAWRGEGCCSPITGTTATCGCSDDQCTDGCCGE